MLAMDKCSFCGSDKVEVWQNKDGAWGKCLNCQALGPFMLGGTIKAASDKWNTRAYGLPYAAAPELLEALGECTTLLESASRMLTEEMRGVLNGKSWGQNSIDKARAAIAKATGQEV